MKSQWGHRRAWEVAEKYLNDLTRRPPSGCRWCGLAKYGHCQQWIEPVGWHKWEHPTTVQIKLRMWERRQDRNYIQEHRRRLP